MNISVPEPSPINKGEAVTPKLIEWIMNCSEYSIESREEVKKLIEQRQNYGINKYGQSLMTKDGRDSVEDAVQELGDLLQYTCKAIINKEDINKIKIILPFLEKMINEESTNL